MDSPPDGKNHQSLEVEARMGPPPDGNKHMRWQTIAMYVSIIVAIVMPLWASRTDPAPYRVILLFEDGTPALGYFLKGNDGTAIYPDPQGEVQMPPRWKGFWVYSSQPIRAVEHRDAKDIHDGSTIMIKLTKPADR